MSGSRRNMRAIVICGARRTGTTLMNQILCSDPGSHDQVGEARLLAKFIELFQWSEDNYENVVQWYFKDEPTFRGFFEETLDRMLDHAVEVLSPGDKLILKTPTFSNAIDATLALMPNTSVVVCVRSPFDQIVSEYEVGLRQIEQGLKETNRASRRDFAGWARIYASAYDQILAAAEAAPDRFYFVRYEDVIGKTAETLADMERSLGLDLSSYDPEADWKNFKNREALEKMPANVPQYGAPLDASRVGRYTDVLKPEEVEAIRTICERAITRFYPEDAAMAMEEPSRRKWPWQSRSS